MKYWHDVDENYILWLLVDVSVDGEHMLMIILIVGSYVLQYDELCDDALQDNFYDWKLYKQKTYTQWLLWLYIIEIARIMIIITDWLHL